MPMIAVDTLAGKAGPDKTDSLMTMRKIKTGEEVPAMKKILMMKNNRYEIHAGMMTIMMIVM